MSTPPFIFIDADYPHSRSGILKKWTAWESRPLSHWGGRMVEYVPASVVESLKKENESLKQEIHSLYRKMNPVHD